MDLNANAIGPDGIVAGPNTAGNAGGDGLLYSVLQKAVTVPSSFVVTGGNGSAGGADVADTGGCIGGTGGNGVNFSGQNGTAFTTGDFTGLVNDGIITGGDGGSGSVSGAATSGDVSGGSGGYGGNGITAYANFSEISGAGTVIGGHGGTGGNGGTAGDTGGSGGFGGDGIIISNNNTELNSMGAVAGGIGGNGGIGDNTSSGNGGYGGLGILVAASAATLAVNNSVTGGLGGNGGAANGGGQAGMAGDGGYGIDIDALGKDAELTIGTAATILGGSIGVNGATGAGIAAVNGAVDGVGIGVEGTGGTITNNGTVEGGSAGAGVATAIYASTTQLTNTGHIAATTGDGVRVEDYFNYGAVTLSTLNNTNGTISATTGNSIEVDGDIGGGHIGTLTNSGTISATSGDGILIDNAGGGGATIGNITNTGTISSITGIALNAINGGSLTTLDNSGVIDGALHLDNAGIFNNSGVAAISGTIGTLNNTGTVTIDSGKTLATTAASGDGAYTFLLTPGSTTLNGTEGQLISNKTNLTGATIGVTQAAGSFVNDSLFEIVAGTSAARGVTTTPTDVGATHGDTASYKFYDVLGGATLSSAFGGVTVPGNADDVFIIAVKQNTTADSPPIAGVDNFTGTENTPITGNMLINDTDPNGLALSVTAAILTTTHGATVTENTDGTFTYIPTAGYTGPDSFSYILEDSAGLTATGIASVSISAPASSAPVFTGTTNNQTLNANENIGSILNGYGNDLLEGHNGNDTLNGGTGNEKLYGYYGNDYIVGGTGNDTMNGGPGNDTLVAGHGSDLMTGDGGADHFVFNTASLNTGTNTITDFSASAGNLIDISNILSGNYNAGTSVLSNFVNIVNSGSNSVLEVDLTGHAGASGWTHVATLLNETNLNEQTLVAHGNLIV